MTKRTLSQIADESLLLKIAVVAIRVGGRCMASYGHEFSPKRFTKPQLFACLILRHVLKTTYRDIIEELALMPRLREAIGLEVLPHFTTWQRFSGRTDVLKAVDRRLKEVAVLCKVNPRDQLSIDATGLETTNASAHCVARSGCKGRRVLKVSMIIVCSLILPVALMLSWGPGPDIVQARPLARKAAEVSQPSTLWGDKGYDCDDWHEFCFEGWGVESFAPPRRGGASWTIGGKHRWMMRNDWERYGNRWASETVHSTMKRTLGSTLAGRSERTQMDDAALKVFAYALRVWPERD